MTRKQFYLKMITSSIMRRRSRMLIALLAVAIGSTILSGLVTIYYDVPRQMGQEFRSYGANMTFVPSGAGDILQEDLDKALSFVSQNKLVGASSYRYETITVNRLGFMAGGVKFDSVKKTRPYWLVNGEYPAKTREVLAGQTVAQSLALKNGSEINLDVVNENGEHKNYSVKVTGILQTGGAEEECIFMDSDELSQVTGSAGICDVAELSISASADELAVIRDRIDQNVPGITARLVKRVTQSEGTVLKKLQSLVWIVTCVVLVLTMVCVATTMMAVVTERRKEIGLKKALGASNQNLVEEFLGEGLFLGGLGGVLGVILGFAFAHAVSLNVFGRSISFQWGLVPVTIIVSVIITALACLIPVRSATTVDPVIVLRGE